MLWFALFCLSLLRLGSTSNVRTMTFFSSITVNEERLLININFYQIFLYPNASGHYPPWRFRGYRGVSYKIRSYLKAPLQNFVKRRKHSWTKLYSDGTARGVMSYKAQRQCQMLDGDKFPRDGLRCFLVNTLSSEPLDCGSYGKYKCINYNNVKQAKWKVASVTTRWLNFSKRNYYSIYTIKLSRNPGYILQRIELPIILFGIILISQLILPPVSHIQRLFFSVLIHICLQLVFVTVVHFPMIDLHGGGAIFSNLVAAMLSFNFVVFAWSVAAIVLLENLATAPLPAALVQLLDVMCDKAGSLLLIPSQIVKNEESKSFSRRGDWLKLILAIDRILILLGIIYISICISQWLP